ncbi:MAG: DUF1456 family protein [Sulfurovum sp.]|nr:DUF1456 family protein [Sulfurovum sp.]
MIINTNEILYKIQKTLKLSQKDILTIYALEAYDIEETHVAKLLLRHQEEDFVLCSYEELGVFLDALVTYKRGPSPKKAENTAPIELSNNLILKKLRIALELKEAEIAIILGLADITLSKQQLSSLFRKEGHKNFKPCSDTLLMSFLEGLDEFYYEGKEV